jgi:DNA-binding transcriptional MerR regulator
MGAIHMKDLYSIHEFSKLSGVDSSILRHWDSIGLFSPMQRNVENNYRYYSIAQILALNFVTTLRDLGIPLKTIAEFREERNPEAILSLLEKREKELDMELCTLRTRYSIIHARQDLIRRGLKVDELDISVMHLDKREFILWPRNTYHENDSFIDPLTTFIHQAKHHFVNLSFPVGGYWDSMESYQADSSRPEHFFTIDPLGTYIQEEGEYLVGFTRGYYADLGTLPERMAAYAQTHALNLSGPVYTVYLQEETCLQDSSQYLAQSYIAVSQ